MPEILQAVAAEDYKVYAYMNDGTVHLYDAAPLLKEPKGVFRKIADPTAFRERLTVMNGTIAWDIEGSRNERKCIDIDPFTVYESPVVKDPLEEME